MGCKVVKFIDVIRLWFLREDFQLNFKCLVVTPHPLLLKSSETIISKWLRFSRESSDTGPIHQL